VLPNVDLGARQDDFAQFGWLYWFFFFAFAYLSWAVRRIHSSSTMAVGSAGIPPANRRCRFISAFTD
jgi:hypothetical protein